MRRRHTNTIMFSNDHRAGESVLHIAGRLGDAQMVKMLIHHGADLALQNNSCNTMLHLLPVEYVNNPHNQHKYIQVRIWF